LQKSKADYHEEALILLTFKICVKAPLHIFPTAFVNFVTRTVIGTIWAMFLTVAEEVRDGKRPVHQAAIEEKQEFYDWVRDRADKVLDILGKDEEPEMAATATADAQEMEASNEKPVVAVENLLSGTF
jgi:hypothetical protein